MIELNGHPYRLIVLDTNVVSEMVKHPRAEFRGFVGLTAAADQPYIPCFSVFSILELRRSPEVYEEFLRHFSILPCALVKSVDQLFEEELASYTHRPSINPLLLGFAGPLAGPAGGASLRETLETYFSSQRAREAEEAWLAACPGVVNDIVALARKWQPEPRQATPTEVRTFVELAVFQQIAMRACAFSRATLNRREVVNVDCFPSLKMLVLNVYFKYYVDNRKPEASDAFDLLIASAAPYVDAFATERHQAEVFRRIKHRDAFLDHLSVLTLRDLRAASDSSKGA